MFNFDRRSVMLDIVTVGSVLLILFSGVLLSGCAVSGCGNPIVIDSNDYANEQNSLTVNRPDHKLREPIPIQRGKIRGKYNRYF